VSSRLAVAAVALLVLVAGADALRHGGGAPAQPPEPAFVTPGPELGTDGYVASVDLFDGGTLYGRTPELCNRQGSSAQQHRRESDPDGRCVVATAEFAPTEP
jgi:hypothetical protein